MMPNAVAYAVRRLAGMLDTKLIGNVRAGLYRLSSETASEKEGLPKDSPSRRVIL